MRYFLATLPGADLALEEEAKQMNHQARDPPPPLEGTQLNTALGRDDPAVQTQLIGRNKRLLSPWGISGDLRDAEDVAERNKMTLFSRKPSFRRRKRQTLGPDHLDERSDGRRVDVTGRASRSR